MATGNAKIATNTVVLFVRLMISMCISLYTTRILLNILGVEDFGLNNVVFGFVATISFLRTSVASGFQRYVNVELGTGNINRLKDVVSSSYFITLLLVIVIVVLGETIGLWFVSNKLTIPEGRFYAAKIIYQFAILSTAFGILSSPLESLVIAHEKMTAFAVVGLSESIIRLGIVILVGYLDGDKLILYCGFYILLSLLAFLFYIFYCINKFQESKVFPKYQKPLFESMIGFSGWTTFGALAATLQGQGLNIVLNMFFGPVVNAARGIAYQIDSAVEGLSSSFSSAYRPQLVQSYAKGDIERVLNILYMASKVSFFLLFLLAVPIIAEIDSILELWLGENIPEHTQMFTILVICIACIHTPSKAITGLMQAYGDIKSYQIITNTILILVVPVAYIVLKFGGSPESAFIVSLIIMICTVSARLIIAKNKLRILSISNYVKKVVLPCLIVALLSPVVPMIIRSLIDPGLFRLLFSCVIDIIATIGLIYYLGLTKQERHAIKNIILTRFIHK